MYSECFPAVTNSGFLPDILLSLMHKFCMISKFILSKLGGNFVSWFPGHWHHQVIKLLTAEHLQFPFSFVVNIISQHYQCHKTIINKKICIVSAKHFSIYGVNFFLWIYSIMVAQLSILISSSAESRRWNKNWWMSGRYGCQSPQIQYQPHITLAGRFPLWLIICQSIDNRHMTSSKQETQVSF